MRDKPKLFEANYSWKSHINKFLFRKEPIWQPCVPVLVPACQPASPSLPSFLRRHYFLFYKVWTCAANTETNQHGRVGASVGFSRLQSQARAGPPFLSSNSYRAIQQGCNRKKKLCLRVRSKAAKPGNFKCHIKTSNVALGFVPLQLCTTCGISFRSFPPESCFIEALLSIDNIVSAGLKNRPQVVTCSRLASKAACSQEVEARKYIYRWRKMRSQNKKEHFYTGVGINSDQDESRFFKKLWPL